MTKNEFLKNLHEEMDIESVNELSETTEFKSLEEWDSMNSMIFTAYIEDNFGITLSKEQIEKLVNLSDVMDLIGRDKFGN